MFPMNTQDAIKHLKSIGFFVENFGKNYKIRRIGRSETPWSAQDFYTARELIKFAKSYSSENNQNTALKNNLKTFDKSKNRAKTRNLTSVKDEEKLDEFGPNAKIKRENRWNWD